MMALENFEKQYNTLIANLSSGFVDKTLKSILFVGSSEGNGTSTIATNFAHLLAKSKSAKVLLVYTNDNNAEMSELLTETDSTNNLFKVKSSNLFVFICNKHLAKNETIFQPSWFELAYEKFDYVIFDGPVAFDTPRMHELSSKIDGTVLVVESGKTRQQVALRAKKQLENAGARILGVVLNKKEHFIPKSIYQYLYQ